MSPEHASTCEGGDTHQPELADQGGRTAQRGAAGIGPARRTESPTSTPGPAASAAGFAFRSRAPGLLYEISLGLLGICQSVHANRCEIQYRVGARLVAQGGQATMGRRSVSRTVPERQERVIESGKACRPAAGRNGLYRVPRAGPRKRIQNRTNIKEPALAHDQGAG